MHVYATEKLTYYNLHPKRGQEANAHLLRELIYLMEEENCRLAKTMIELLLDTLHKKQEAGITKKYISKTREKYLKIIRGRIKKIPNPEKIRKPGERGKIGRTKELNLLLQMEELHESILRFMTDPDVPFDNNLAERNLRMIKLQQKTSGCFRTQEAGMFFARNRSYISTLRKNGFPILQGIRLGLSNCPILPSLGGIVTKLWIKKKEMEEGISEKSLFCRAFCFEFAGNPEIRSGRNSIERRNAGL